MDLDTMVILLIGLTILCFTIYKIINRILEHIEILKGVRKPEEDSSNFKISIGSSDEEE